jgi:hypothetical protein
MYRLLIINKLKTKCASCWSYYTEKKGVPGLLIVTIFIYLALRKTTCLVRISDDTKAVTSSYLLNTSVDDYQYFSLLRDYVS